MNTMYPESGQPMVVYEVPLNTPCNYRDEGGGLRSAGGPRELGMSSWWPHALMCLSAQPLCECLDSVCVLGVGMEASTVSGSGGS